MDRSDVTGLLVDWQNGDSEALDRLMPLVYDELRSLARSAMRGGRSRDTMQPTVLVNEAYLHLIDQTRMSWQSRTQFFYVASKLMRRVLIDHIRSQQAEKRGGEAPRLALDEALGVPEEGGGETRQVDILAIDEALNRLAERDGRQARIVEMRFFAGLSVEETAAALDISKATVKREWAMAKAWLLRWLTKKQPG